MFSVVMDLLLLLLLLIYFLHDMKPPLRSRVMTGRGGTGVKTTQDPPDETFIKTIIKTRFILHKQKTSVRNDSNA